MHNPLNVARHRQNYRIAYTFTTNLPRATYEVIFTTIDVSMASIVTWLF